MKKWISALLAALLAALMPAVAMAAEGDVIVPCGMGTEIEENFNSFCEMDNALYMLSDEALYVHAVGDTEPKRYDMEFEEVGFPQSRNSVLMSDGERLLLMDVVADYSRDAQEAKAALYELTLNGDAVERTLLLEPDWEFMRQSDGQYYRYAERMMALKGCLLITTYDESGNRLLIEMDLSDGSTVETNTGDMYAMAPYTDNRALIEQYSDAEDVQFSVYDPATHVLEPLSTLAVELGEPFDGLACDVNSGEVYFVRGGELHSLDVLTGEVSEPIATMPLDTYGDNGGRITENGYYVCATYNAYLIRSLHPESKASRNLRVVDSSYASGVTSAYYSYANAHSDVDVVLSRDWSEASVIDGMMNRDSSVDVYIMSASNPDYEAVHNRGFMAGFGQSEELSALAEKMPSSLLEQLSANGEFSALPVQAYYWLPRVNEKVLEKLDMTIEDLPTNWSDFIDFLLEVQDRWPQDLTLLDPWTSAQSARRELFNQIFQTYQTLLAQDPDLADSRAMTEILTKLERVDFGRLGQPDDSVFEEDGYDPVYDENRILLTVNTGTNLAGLTDYNTPIVMALMPDAPLFMPVDLEVAFVNPYSENLDLALEFVEEIARKMDSETNALLCPDEAEPTLNPWYEENLKYAEDYLAETEKALEEAEEVDRQMLEEQLESAKQNLEWAQSNMYSIREEDIAWLKANIDKLIVQGSNWLYGEDSGDAWDLVEQYAEGRIDANRLMKEIDSKVRMMLMEGY